MTRARQWMWHTATHASHTATHCNTHQSEWREPDNESDTATLGSHTATHTKVRDESPTINQSCHWFLPQGLFPLRVAAFCSVLQCAMQRVDRVLTLAVIVPTTKGTSFVVYGVWWGKSLAIQLHILLYSPPKLTAHNKTPCWIQYHNKKLALIIVWGQQHTCPVSYYGMALVSRIDNIIGLFCKRAL